MDVPLGVVVGETLPQGPGEQLTVQLTPALFGSLFTCAENWPELPPTCTVPDCGEVAMVIACTVMLAEAFFVGSDNDAAVSVTTKSLAGGVPGAVYVTCTPLADAADETVPHCATAQDSVQLTPFKAESLLTTAVKLVVVPN